MQEREGDDQTECPQCHEQDQRERPEHREHVLPPVTLGKSSRRSPPGRPQEPVEGPCRPEPSYDAAGEDDGLERIPQDDEDESTARTAADRRTARTLQAECVLRKRTGLAPQVLDEGALLVLAAREA
jgi:hypothetical protein